MGIKISWSRSLKKFSLYFQWCLENNRWQHRFNFENLTLARVSQNSAFIRAEYATSPMRLPRDWQPLNKRRGSEAVDMCVTSVCFEGVLRLRWVEFADYLQDFHFIERGLFISKCFSARWCLWLCVQTSFIWSKAKLKMNKTCSPVNKNLCRITITYPTFQDCESLKSGIQICCNYTESRHSNN